MLSGDSAVFRSENNNNNNYAPPLNNPGSAPVLNVSLYVK